MTTREVKSQPPSPNGVDVMNVLPIHVRSAARNDADPGCAVGGVRQLLQDLGDKGPSDRAEPPQGHRNGPQQA
jgi:hypothetical protein